jgi:hypothetical protein
LREGVFSSSFSLPWREGQREGEVAEEKYFLRKRHPHPHPLPSRERERKKELREREKEFRNNK